MKKNDPDILVLKRAKAALLKSSSKKMMRANLNYLYDFFVTNPSESLQEYWAKVEAAEQKMHPTLGESVVSDNESKPAPKRVI